MTEPSPAPPVPSPTAPPAVRIVWDVGRISAWYELLRAVPRSTLSQSFGHAQAALTIDRWRPRLGLIELADRPIGLVVVLEKRLLGTVRLIRVDRGPLIRPEAAKPAVIASVFKALRAAYPPGLTRWASILPELPAGPDSEGPLRWAGFRRRPGEGYRTIWLDLSRAEADLRAGLAQKWRNALNQAERNGLSVEVDRMGDTLPWLLERSAEDRAAKGYRGPSPAFLTRLCTGMRKDGDVLILRAVRDGVPVAGVLLLGHGRAATYQMGWTGPEGRRVRAHHLLLWRAVLELKAQGRLWLDLGGVHPASAPGVTAFKRGLGGEEVELAGTWA